jgi:CO/xanthine dehydrogenase Mo-binding subunit
MPTAFEHQMPPPGPAAHFVGSSVARKEDKRLLTGHGLYVDDVVLPGMLHAAFVRSELAKATITHLDTTEARRLPGVVAVFTWEDFDGRCGEAWHAMLGEELPVRPGRTPPTSAWWRSTPPPAFQGSFATSSPRTAAE